MAAASLRGAGAAAGCASLFEIPELNRKLFLHDVVIALRTAHFLSGGKHKLLKVMLATAAVVFEYGHRSSPRLGALCFNLFLLDALAQRIFTRDRLERGYFQPVAAQPY